MASLLLAEDDEQLARALSLALRRLGHEIQTVSDGPAVLAAVENTAPGALLLDVMMPGMDGFEVCRRLRRHHQIPIIMLTARSDAIDIVAGLEAGADDYVTKPVEPRVLDARIKAVLRRTTTQPDAQLITVGDLVLDQNACQALVDEQPLALTPTEWRLLLELAHNVGRVLSRHVLLERVWGYDYTGDSRMVDAAIQRLRAKVEPAPAHPTMILTVRGMGYRLVQP